MITEVEREIINYFNELSLVNTIDAKLQLYRKINQNLETFTGQSDNFNFKNYCKQINYDLRNFNSIGMYFEVTKFFSLLKSRILSMRYSVKISPGKDVVLALIENLKTALDNNMRMNNDVEFIERFCELFIDRKMAQEILLKADDQFYQLAKEIFQTKKFSCYTPILTILSKLEKSRAELNGPSLADDETKLSFWFEILLSQLFETKDEGVLNEILLAFDCVLPIMSNLNYRSKSFWPQVKTNIIDTYSEKLGEMRGWCTCWYKIWNLLVRIVNIEILRSASVINKFLSIVELGFRNDNLKIRAQAHLCWKNLIEIFALSNELNVPKRIKLLCIPFKSGKMRAAEIAVNKFKAWWYLIIQLKHNILEHIDTILVPFLEYTFGKYSAVPLEWYFDKDSLGPGVLVPVSKHYVTLRMASIVSFIYLFSSPNKTIETIRVKCDMDSISEKIDFSQHMSDNFAKSIINYCGEATVLVSLLSSQQNQNMFVQLLWNGMLEQIANKNCYENFESIMANMEAFVKIGQIKLAENTSLPKFIGDILGILMDANVYPFKEVNGSFNHDDILKALQALQKFFLNDNAVYYLTLSKTIIRIYSELNQYKSSKLIYDFVNDFAMTTGEIGNDDHRINIKLEIWNALAKSILIDLNENTYDKCNEVIVAFLNYLIKLKNVDVDAAIVENWKQIYTKCSIQKFDLNETVMKTIKTEVETVKKDDLKYLINFLIIILSNNIENIQTKITQILGLYDVILEKIVAYVDSDCDYHENTLIQSLSMIIVKFDLYCFLKPQIIKDLKNVIQLFKKLSENVKYKKSLHDSFMKLKQHIITKLKPEMNNNIVKELLKLCDEDFQRGNTNNNINSNNAFVVIPNVWSLKPETLTEHQVEKMKERKDDIPAMYCDLSQSQDSMSIKPWTPKKPFTKEDRSTTIEDTNKHNKENDQQNLSFTNQIKSNDIIDASQTDPPPATLRISGRRSSSRNSNNTSVESTNGSTLLVEPVTKLPESPKKTRSQMSPKKSPTTNNNKEKASKDSEKYVCELKGSESPKKLVIKLNRPNNEDENTENSKLDAIQFDTPPQDTPPQDTPPQDIQPETVMDTEPNTSLLIDDSFGEKITNKSIRSSPEHSDTEEREKDLINSTLELSPILCDEKQLELSNFVKTPPATISGVTALNSPSSSSSLNNSLTNNKFLIRRTPRDILAQSKSAALYSSSSPNSSTTVNCRYHRGKHMMSLIAAQKQSVISCSPEQKKKDDKGTGLLTFSKKLPPSDASPSISILKRKLIEDSVTEVESPALKRKRVSFHDPPVSATKEYVTEDNKSKNTVKRCLMESPLSTKQLLTTEIRAGTSSINISGDNLENYIIDDDEDDVQEISSVTGSSFSGMNTLRIDGSSTTIDVDDDDHISITPSPSISFANDEAVLQYVLEKYSLTELKHKYAIEKPSTSREELLPRYDVLVHELTGIINYDDNSKIKLLEYLSENYSKEFLQYALQENSSKTVCDLLNYQYLLEYIMTNRLNNNETKEQFNKSFIQNFQTLSDELLAIIKNNLTNDNGSSDTLLVKLFKIVENLYELRSYNNLHKNKNEMDDVLFNHLFKLFSNKLSKDQILECVKEKL